MMSVSANFRWFQRIARLNGGSAYKSGLSSGGMAQRFTRDFHNKMRDEDPFQVLRKDLFSVARRIKGDFPYSASVHNSLLLHGRGHANECSFYTLRDHPESHIVMWQYLQPRNTLIALHCREDEVHLLKEALMHSELIDWQGNVCFFHVPEYLAETVNEVMKSKGGQGLHMNKCFTFTTHNVEESLAQAKQELLRCPSGVRVSRLGRAGVRIMRNTSEYDFYRTLDDMDHIAKHAPSVGIYEDPTAGGEALIDITNIPFAGDQEVPRAWITTSFYGGLGTLLTQPQYRGYGYGRLLVHLAVLMQAAQGYVPQSHVDIANLPAFRMNSKVPSYSFSHYVYFMHRNAIDELEVKQAAELYQ